MPLYFLLFLFLSCCPGPITMAAIDGVRSMWNQLLVPKIQESLSKSPPDRYYPYNDLISSTSLAQNVPPSRRGSRASNTLKEASGAFVADGVAPAAEPLSTATLSSEPSDNIQEKHQHPHAPRRRTSSMMVLPGIHNSNGNGNGSASDSNHQAEVSPSSLNNNGFLKGLLAFLFQPTTSTPMNQQQQQQQSQPNFKLLIILLIFLCFLIALNSLILWKVVQVLQHVGRDLKILERNLEILKRFVEMESLGRKRWEEGVVVGCKGVV
jgi:hypothetical protein